MGRKNSILGLSGPVKNLYFFIFLYLSGFKISCSAELSIGKIIISGPDFDGKAVAAETADLQRR